MVGTEEMTSVFGRLPCSFRVDKAGHNQTCSLNLKKVGLSRIKDGQPVAQDSENIRWLQRTGRVSKI